MIPKPSERSSPHPVPRVSVISGSAAISSLEKASEWQLALETLQEMEVMLVTPNVRLGKRNLCCILPRDVRTSTFGQSMGFPSKPLKLKLSAGEQKATEKPKLLWTHLLWMDEIRSHHLRNHEKPHCRENPHSRVS